MLTSLEYISTVLLHGGSSCLDNQIDRVQLIARARTSIAAARPPAKRVANHWTSNSPQQLSRVLCDTVHIKLD
jgi:hypothetical protein